MPKASRFSIKNNIVLHVHFLPIRTYNTTFSDTNSNINLNVWFLRLAFPCRKKSYKNEIWKMGLTLLDKNVCFIVFEKKGRNISPYADFIFKKGITILSHACVNIHFRRYTVTCMPLLIYQPKALNLFFGRAKLNKKT